ncbi:HAMP domain-containing sensor histidine kinase [Clostridiaceae bacterium M8S5]|nr:HAMP domain-containing sensor histidine kinase [Clostridiaceae bacterium M8S5]
MRSNIITQKIRVKLLLSIVICYIVAVYCSMFSVSFIKSILVDDTKALSKTTEDIFSFSYFAVYIIAYILIFFFISKKKIEYIEYITKQVKIIADKNFSSTLEVRGDDEFAQLSRSINYMSIELKKKFEKERELEKSKTELITNISHDLRTPLTAIIGYLDLLKNEKYKNREEEKEYLISTYNLSIKLKMLIDELFEYTKLSSSGITLDLEEVDLGSILIQILGEYTPVFESKDLNIISDIDEKIPVKIDIEKIVRVFDNIFSNAQKYSVTPSNIIVNVKNKADTVCVSVSNKGEYIEQDKLSKIFENFYRMDVSRTSNIEGSGLGLAISKKIVDLHQGEIWAECHGDIITINISLPISYSE